MKTPTPLLHYRAYRTILALSRAGERLSLVMSFVSLSLSVTAGSKAVRVEMIFYDEHRVLSTDAATLAVEDSSGLTTVPYPCREKARSFIRSFVHPFEAKQ
jgi:hypothetical protein